MKLDIRSYDLRLLVLLIIIQVISLFAIYSATYKGSTSGMFLKHLVYLVFGWLVMLIFSRINYRLLCDMSLFIFMLNLFLLILVPFVGKTVYGAKRWIDVGPINLQPSEFMKFSLIIFLSFSIVHIRKLLSKETGVMLVSLMTASLLTLKQPDLGTTITYWVIFVSLLFLYGIKIRYFVIFGIALVLASPILWNLLKDYQKNRILAVIDPYRDYMGSGYQIIQSMIAVGSGGLFGKGFLKGTQVHLLFLPEKHTDFIFATVAEEWGFFVSLLLISCFFGIFFILTDYAMRVQDKTARLLLGSSALLILFQSFTNLMMTMGMAPVVGIPLPFVSYGGSAILTFSLILGVCLSIIREYRMSPIKFHQND